ncbi:MAG TPA: peptide ABC transporter ATP-binding protein [Clostridiales bacterium]|jgi:peptide/nickel transport system ATP-binding protein/oligopeptide transport system ATP-binding protein|nr:peptide ABC transporter ATP-binding protein [Clostridiales bacterium]
MNDTILEVRGLKTYFKVEEGEVPAVDGVDFSISKKETLAIVGESGSGKSVTALSILRLIQTPPGKIVAGEIQYDGKDLLKLSEKEMRKIRGNDISMIFQEPMTSLNPVITVGKQISEVLKVHQGLSTHDAHQKSIEMIKLVGIPNAEKRVTEYPHQLSGGMRQRIMIAMALACNPKVLIADEPTTALDVTIQSQILKLMIDLKENLETAIVLITHDLGVVAQLAENVMVMYAGKAVEYGDVKSIFKNPLHPYTIGLLNSIPRIDQELEKLTIIEGTVPSPLNLPKGCKFCTRCSDSRKICFDEEPEYIEMEGNRKVRCWKYIGAGYYD